MRGGGVAGCRLEAMVTSLSTDTPAWKDCPGCPRLGDAEVEAEEASL